MIPIIKRAVPVYDRLAGAAIHLVDENHVIIGYLVLCGPITQKIPGNPEISQNITFNIAKAINDVVGDA